MAETLQSLIMSVVGVTACYVGKMDGSKAFSLLVLCFSKEILVVSRAHWCLTLVSCAQILPSTPTRGCGSLGRQLPAASPSKCLVRATTIGNIHLTAIGSFMRRVFCMRGQESTGHAWCMALFLCSPSMHESACMKFSLRHLLGNPPVFQDDCTLSVACIWFVKDAVA